MDVMAYMSRVVQWVYPPRCLLCDGRGQCVGSKAMDLCQYCQQQLPFNQRVCLRCALPLPAASPVTALCGRCQKKSPAFDCSFSLFRYEQPVVWLIQQLKFNQRLSHTRLLGELMAQHVVQSLAARALKPQCILPVPLHNKRLRQRGFNQSIELARPVAKQTGLPLLLGHVERTRPTQAQTGLDARQRRKNIRGAFKLRRPILYDHVAILDDVVTTGSTVNELARVLKKAGVKRVDVWSIARAV